MTATPTPPHGDDDLLTVAEAARVAHRSARTLRRAYLSGRMVAHRDGNGRGVTIRYRDLLAWLTAEVIVPAPGRGTDGAGRAAPPGKRTRRPGGDREPRAAQRCARAARKARPRGRHAPHGRQRATPAGG